MRQIRLAIGVLAMSLVVLGAAPEPKTGTIVGTVVQSDGKAAADCVVTVQQAAQAIRKTFTATTDADGKFKIEKVPEGDYNLNVRTRDAKGKAIKSLSVTADETTDVGKLTLKSK